MPLLRWIQTLPLLRRALALRGGRRQLGRLGEELAEAWLVARGMRCVGRNLRVPGGEIDLVMMEPDGTVVCVEVKTRILQRRGSRPGEQAITPAKRSRMGRSALLAARDRGWHGRALRLDVIAIDFPADSAPRGPQPRAGGSGDGVRAPVIRHHRAIAALPRGR